MKFTTPATTNPIDRLRYVGKPLDRIDGPLKCTGTAPYAYEHHREVPNAAHGFVVGSAIAKGRIAAIEIDDARPLRHQHGRRHGQRGRDHAADHEREPEPFGFAGHGKRLGQPAGLVELDVDRVVFTDQR